MSKISELTYLSNVDPANDVLPIVDVSDTTTKKITPLDMYTQKVSIPVNKELTDTDQTLTTSLNQKTNVFAILFKQNNRHFFQLCTTGKAMSFSNVADDGTGNVESRIYVWATGGTVLARTIFASSGYPVTAVSIYEL